MTQLEYLQADAEDLRVKLRWLAEHIPNALSRMKLKGVSEAKYQSAVSCYYLMMQHCHERLQDCKTEMKLLQA